MNNGITLDRIHIRDLAVRCILGLRDWERKKKQDVLINLTLHADLVDSCTSNRIEDTIDYKNLKDRILDTVEDSRFRLIERLAETIADICLVEPRVCQVDVAVDKPGALRFSRSVAVEITRSRGT